MDYCGPRSIPHSVFLGRVVRPGDPQWLPTDSGLALAWAQHKAEVCPGCGTRHDEWAADDHDDDTPDPYVKAKHYCRGCDLLTQAKGDLPKDQKGNPLPGWHAFLMPEQMWRAVHPDEPLPDNDAPTPLADDED